MPFRFARFAAVSTRDQNKPGKFSLDNQLESTLETGTGRGWVESAGPFVAIQSRELYNELSDAEREIPAIHDMLQSARNGEYDILLVSETDRLRSLQVGILRRLAQYHVQLYFVNLPIEPVAPEKYTIYKADNVLMLLTMTQMTSSLEINRTRRKWFENMPKRITELGLPATHIPYGYRKPPGHEHDRKAIPEPDPDLKFVVLKIKDLHLSGVSSYQIAEILQKSRVAAPRSRTWHPVTVRDILKNPFYSGTVQFGKSRVYLDPATDTRKRNRSIPSDQIHQNKGKHTPLWDEATHRLILLELARRTKTYRGRANNQLTGLPKCGTCGATLWRQGNGPRGAHRLIWRCSSTGSAIGHINIPHVVLLERLGESLQKIRLHPHQASPSDPNLQPSNLRTFERKLSRLEDAYLAGQFDLPDYTRRRAELTEQIHQAQDTVEKQKALETQRLQFEQSLHTLTLIEDLPHWLLTTDPGEVNHVLRSVIAKIVVREDGIEIVMK